MKIPIRNIQILSLLGLLIAAGQVGAIDGDIVYTYGEVVVHRRSNVLPAEIGMPVGQGDVIETGGQAMAVISLLDGAEMKLRENTTLSLDSLGQRVSVHLSTGSVFSRVNKQIISGFSVKTETAIMGVRGTEFFVAYGRTIDRHPDIWVCVNTGSVEVAIIETQDTLIVEEGEGINIVGGTNLTSPQRYPWTRKLNWNMDPAAGEVIDRTDLEQAYSDLLDQDYD
jgi:ferric-dicitrate binding protein FerR (iron transport regulator)